MVAKFPMCEEKGSNLIYYFLSYVTLFFTKLATGWLQGISFVKKFICN